MDDRRVQSRPGWFIALIVANALAFVIAWVLALRWQHSGWLVGVVVATAIGLTLGQFLILAFVVVLQPRPLPRHWLAALGAIAAASLGFCALELLVQQRWLDNRWIVPTYALVNQLVLFLSLVAVGVLLLLVVRLMTWPCRRLLSWRMEWEHDPLQSVDPRQFSLAEVFLLTAGVASGCWLGRSLFDASLAEPLIHGTMLLVAALPMALLIFTLSGDRWRWRQWEIVVTSGIVYSLMLTPLLAFAHEYTYLLAGWIGWTILEPWSPRTLVIAAAFNLSVAVAAKLNWLALARLGLRRHTESTRQPRPDGSAARLTPAAPPR